MRRDNMREELEEQEKLERERENREERKILKFDWSIIILREKQRCK